MLEKLLKLDTFKQWFEKINNIINKTNDIDKEFTDYKTNVNNKFSSDVWSKKQHNYGTIPISLLSVNKASSIAYIKEYNDERFQINKVEIDTVSGKYILRNDKYHFMVSYDINGLGEKVQIANYDEVVSLTRDESVDGYKTLTKKLLISGADILPFGSWRESIKLFGDHASININENIGIGLHDINRSFYLLDHVNKRYGVQFNFDTNILTFPQSNSEVIIGDTKVKDELSKKLYTSNVSITTGTIAHGGTIPLPAGYTAAQCKFFVSAKLTNPNWSNWDIAEDQSHMHFRFECSVTAARVVTAMMWYNDSRSQIAGTANYIIIGIK